MIRLRAFLAEPRAQLALVAVAAAALRARVLLGPGGAWGYPVDYDEGVYFSASALLLRGVLPWRDFVFVHPPGVLLGWAPLAAFDAARGFALCRFAAALLGGVNVYLLGRLLLPRVGALGALAAAALYAAYPEAMATERGPFIEPWLNFICLLAADYSLRERWTRAGALWAVALLIKLWALLWMPAVLLLWLRTRSRSAVVAFFGTLAALCGPFVALDPAAFWHQVVSLQLHRPPDATQGMWQRLTEIFLLEHVGVALLGVVAIAGLVRRREPHILLFGVSYAAILAGFLAAAAYWGQYNAHLAVPQCALAGCGVTALSRRRWLASAALVASMWLSLRVRPLEPTRELLEMRGALETLPRCVFAFEPAWALVAAVLPAHGDGAPVIVDSYGAMLAAAPSGRFENADDAMRSASAQAYIRPRLEACPTVVLGPRGDRQLGDDTKAWLRTGSTRTSAAPLETWVRLR